jgi:endo-1,4-beta-D-glucanase Y
MDKPHNRSACIVHKLQAEIKEDAEVVDPSPLNPDNYPVVQYWYQSEHRKEKARRDAQDRDIRTPSRKNTSFWFLQDADGVKNQD